MHAGFGSWLPGISLGASTIRRRHDGLGAVYHVPPTAECAIGPAVSNDPSLCSVHMLLLFASLSQVALAFRTTGGAMWG
jgi:hypothetical protein